MNTTMHYRLPTTLLTSTQRHACGSPYSFVFSTSEIAAVTCADCRAVMATLSEGPRTTRPFVVARRTVNATTLTLTLVDDPSLYVVCLTYPRGGEDDIGDIGDDEVVAFIHEHTVPRADNVTVSSLRWEATETPFAFVRLAMCFFAGAPS